MRKVLTPFNVLSLLLLGAGAFAYYSVQVPPPTPAPPQYGSASERKTVEATLYLPDAQLQGYRTVKRALPVERDTVTGVAQAAMEALVRSSADEDGPKLFPRDVPVPNVWARGEHFFVDLPTAYARLSYGTTGEQMIVCTITQTLLEARGMKDVTFLVNGRNAETLLGHFDLRVPYTKDDCKL